MCMHDATTSTLQGLLGVILCGSAAAAAAGRALLGRVLVSVGVPEVDGQHRLGREGRLAVGALVALAGPADGVGGHVPL